MNFGRRLAGRPTTRGCWVLVWLGVLLAFGAAGGDRLGLEGRWRVRLDGEDVGGREGWAERTLATDRWIGLPGTLDQAGLGVPLDPVAMRHAAEFPYTRFPGVAEPARADQRGFLVNRWLHLGPAWYEREVVIPERWRGQSVTLRFERVLWRSDVWWDGRAVGGAESLATPHAWELGTPEPGRHRLTVRVDNRMLHNLSTITHAYGPETQSRWNGLVGQLELEAHPRIAVRRLEVHPAPDRRSVRVVAEVVNGTEAAVESDWRLAVSRESGRRTLGETSTRVRVERGVSKIEGRVDLAGPADSWDEFRPVRHRVASHLVVVGTGAEPGSAGRAEAWFGFRELGREGRELRINGRPVFLRGTLDCAVYPRTGHPPVTVGEWERVLGTVREYGFNHVRFHTWCPPEAAFEAADRLGLYLAPEVSAWVDDWTRDTLGQPPAIGRDAAVNDFIRAEARRIVEAYGNHPSFVLLCFGNEFGMQGTDWDEVGRWVAEARARDPRRWYVATTARRTLPEDDVWVTHAVNGRAARGVGGAGSDWDFGPAVEASPRPVIAHETGQRPVFPDYDELLPKFRGGPLRPDNYVRLREALEASGLAGQTKAFERASARFQLVQYRAEHEAFRRTRGLAGYQLLMLNDFTGQSEALVGILDPFWESKGVVTAAEVRRWNAPTVLLARFARRTWSNSDTFRARLDVAHHGPVALSGVAGEWRLEREGGGRIARGRLAPVEIPTGAVTALGEVEVPLGGVARAAHVRLAVRLGSFGNAWDHWVYPATEVEPAGTPVLTTGWNEAAEQALAEGRTVVVLAHGMTNAYAARTGFNSVYWSAGWWGNAFSSLGIVCDPRHPVLREFPNDGHSDWQWSELAGGATTFRLDGAPRGFRPVVQLVPDFHYPGLLAAVFEARVGPGRLIVCGYDLDRDLERRPAARQFRRSLLRHAGDAGYRPPQALEPGFVRALLGGRTP